MKGALFICAVALSVPVISSLNMADDLNDADDLADDFKRLIFAGLLFVIASLTNRFLPESKVKAWVSEILLLPIS